MSFPTSSSFLGGPSRRQVVGSILQPERRPSPGTPPEIVPSVTLPTDTILTLPVAIGASAPSESKASTASAVVTGTIATSQTIAQAVRQAVARVPSYKDQRETVAAAITTTAAQRADVARIVDEAKMTLAAFQPSRTTEDGIVVTSKNPGPTDNFALVKPDNPIVPKLLAEPGISVDIGGASNEPGPSVVLILALAAVVFFAIGG